MARHLDPKRMRSLNRAVRGPGPVVYWMSRDQRAADNWALLFAQEMALDAKVPLGVVFALDPSYPPATRRSLGFLLRGLAESARDLGEKGIPFFLLEGPPDRLCRILPPASAPGRSSATSTRSGPRPPGKAGSPNRWPVPS